MNDPYEVLGVGHDADTETIRRRYLELVRVHSPERDPERFSEIREAYDRLRDPIVNLEQRLFDHRSPLSIDEIVSEHQRVDVRGRRLPTDLLLSLGRP